MTINECISRSRAYIKEGKLDVAIGIFYGFEDVLTKADLWDLWWLLDHSDYGCSKGDIEGFLTDLEKYLNEH